MDNIQTFSYHNHTNFSDGRNSLEEMVAHAKQIGFTEMGISDHLIVHKNMKQSITRPFWENKPWSHIFNSDFKEIIEKTKRHCEHIRAVSRSQNFKLYIGFEADFFCYNGWMEEFQDFLSQIDYDYLVSGNHMLFDEKCENVFELSYLKQFCDDLLLRKEYIERHFENINNAVNSKMFNFLAHLDYIRKIGEDVCGDKMFRKEKIAILDSLQKNNIGIEISTKGLRRLGDYYPCSWIRQEIGRRNLLAIISDDAHCVDELGWGFCDAEKELARCGIKNRLHF